MITRNFPERLPSRLAAFTADMINKLSSHPSVVRYGWGNEYYGVNHSSNRFERQYEDTANALDGTRRAT